LIICFIFNLIIFIFITFTIFCIYNFGFILFLFWNFWRKLILIIFINLNIRCFFYFFSETYFTFFINCFNFNIWFIYTWLIFNMLIILFSMYIVLRYKISLIPLLPKFWISNLSWFFIVFYILSLRSILWGMFFTWSWFFRYR